jgi:hypothetical protein
VLISSLFVTQKKNKNQQNYFLTIKSAMRNFAIPFMISYNQQEKLQVKNLESLSLYREIIVLYIREVFYGRRQEWGMSNLACHGPAKVHTVLFSAHPQGSERGGGEGDSAP